MSRRLPGFKGGRGPALTAVVVAGAAPKPTVSQVQAQVNKLQAQTSAAGCLPPPPRP